MAWRGVLTSTNILPLCGAAGGVNCPVWEKFVGKVAATGATPKARFCSWQHDWRPEEAKQQLSKDQAGGGERALFPTHHPTTIPSFLHSPLRRCTIIPCIIQAKHAFASGQQTWFFFLCEPSAFLPRRCRRKCCAGLMAPPRAMLLDTGTLACRYRAASVMREPAYSLCGCHHAPNAQQAASMHMLVNNFGSPLFQGAESHTRFVCTSTLACSMQRATECDCNVKPSSIIPPDRSLHDTPVLRNDASNAHVAGLTPMLRPYSMHAAHATPHACKGAC